MSNTEIKPEMITKPMQLLGGWLAGLILTNSGFLIAAGNITTPTWAAGALVVAAILNVPLFLAALFLLQTKFRVHLQEDQYYSEYLKDTAYGQIYSTIDLKLGGADAEVIRRRLDEIKALTKPEEDTKH